MLLFIPVKYGSFYLKCARRKEFGCPNKTQNTEYIMPCSPLSCSLGSPTGVQKRPESTLCKVSKCFHIPPWACGWTKPALNSRDILGANGNNGVDQLSEKLLSTPHPGVDSKQAQNSSSLWTEQSAKRKSPGWTWEGMEEPMIHIQVTKKPFRKTSI